MTRLLIGNSIRHQLVDDVDSPWNAWWAQRLLWFARDGDTILLAQPPDPEFLAYVTDLTGTDRGSLRFVTPPAPEATYRLTPARLTSSAVLDSLAGTRFEAIVPLWPDVAVADLADALGMAHALPGHGFIAQGGGAAADSKAAFRVLAGGVGAPIPAGTVCFDRSQAEDVITTFVQSGRTAMVKGEYGSGASGNRIVGPDPATRPIGAPSVTLATGRSQVRAFLDEHWDALTSAGRFRLIVEQYHADCRSVFAEFLITDDGPRFGAHGEMIMAPTANAQIIPTPAIAPVLLDRLVREAHQLCSAMHAVGYRGRLSCDAVITPTGELFFTEYNGRVTGSTHIYAVLGDGPVGVNAAGKRYILERVGWRVPSFAAALDRLTTAGIAFDRQSGKGVILNTAFRNGVVWYCVAAESADEIAAFEDRVAALFADLVPA